MGHPARRARIEHAGASAAPSGPVPPERRSPRRRTERPLNYGVAGTPTQHPGDPTRPGAQHPDADGTPAIRLVHPSSSPADPGPRRERSIPLDPATESVASSRRWIHRPAMAFGASARPDREPSTSATPAPSVEPKASEAWSAPTCSRAPATFALTSQRGNGRRGGPRPTVPESKTRRPQSQARRRSR